MKVLDNASITGGIELHGKPAVRFESHSNGESFYVFEPALSEEKIVIDPMRASDAFLSAKGSAGFLRVFRAYGQLRNGAKKIALEEVLRIQRYAVALRENTYEAIVRAEPSIKEVEDAVSELLTLPMLLPQWSEPLSLYARCTDIIDALSLMLFLDTAHHRQLLFCARSGCGNTFLREEHSKQKFCQTSCAQRDADAKYKERNKAQIAEKRRQRIKQQKDGSK